MIEYPVKIVDVT